MKKKNLDIKEKNYFRSIDQLAETEEFKQFVEREFPQGASEMNNAWSRRNFLTLMGASVALAGLAGCRRPEEHIVPYVKPPEEVIPGVAQHYATTMTMGASAYGIVVESHEGRPTKIEGNEKHPSSNGAASAMMLSSILGLYDPDRSQKILRNNNSEKSWEDFTAVWQKLFEAHQADKGAGLAIVSGAYASPTIARLRDKFEKQFPQADWATYEAVSDENIYNGIELATRKKLRPVYDYSKADVILSLDSDFITNESESLTASAGFSAGRNLEDEKSSMNRLYVAESMFSSTGAIADHRLPLKFNDIGKLAAALAIKVGAAGGSTELDSKTETWLDAVVDDLRSANGKALVVAGLKQPPEVHTLVFAINEKISSSDCVNYNKFNYSSPADAASLKALSEDISSDKIKTLIVIDCNPAYDAPTDLKFDRLIKKVENTIHFGLYHDETGRLCSWHIPAAHYLEEWSDAEAVDGTLSIVQPLIAPLYDGKMKVELLHLITGGEELPAYDAVRETWNGLVDGNFEKSWRKVLHDGVNTSTRDNSVSGAQVVLDLNGLITRLNEKNNSELELIFTPSSSVFDGRFANNGWQQELPDAVTRLAWDNVAQMSPATAEKFGLKDEDLIRVKVAGNEIELPVWITPGTVDNTIITEFGYGRTKVGRIADVAGVDVYPLRIGGSYSASCEVSPTGRTYPLANVQDHGSMEGRAIVREATLDEYKHEPDFAPHMVHHQPLETMWTETKYDTGYQWGMAIDLTSCTGCNACVVACQSENNVPIIGKEEVKNGREMHWLRLDRYFVADEDNYKESDKVEMVHQPVACHHCELAPCEQVCPVAATVHDDEGLNTMVYNRCIGTRYCSNNCPYKVRRFNFFNFTKETPEVVKMAMNPDVTVRSRGVMEKCTYCTQRIQRVKIDAKKEDRDIRDGEIVVACQQACPSNAISFGNIRDEESKVAKVKKRNRSYNLLEELNVRPRTSYLAKVRNKNPKMPVS